MGVPYRKIEISMIRTLELQLKSMSSWLLGARTPLLRHHRDICTP